MVRHFSLPPSDVGYLTSAYPLGMFFALFAWPRLSDRVGRKPILVLSLLGVGFGLVAQSIAVARDWSLAAFLGLRVASGAFAGASPVVKAYLADAATPERLADYMAWREAACTLAFIVGPTLGGALFTGREPRRVHRRHRMGLRRRRGTRAGVRARVQARGEGRCRGGEGRCRGGDG